MADHLQSELSLPPRPHRDRRLSDDGARRRRGGRLSSAARTAPTRRARAMFSMAMWMAAIVAPLQIARRRRARAQHAGVSAGQGARDGGRFRRRARTARRWCCSAARTCDASRVDYAVEIPHLGSLILKHDPHRAAAGARTISRASDWPPVAARVLVASASWSGWVSRCSASASSASSRAARGRLYDWPWLHRAAVLMGPAGFSPYRRLDRPPRSDASPLPSTAFCATAQSRSPLAAPAVAASLGAFAVVYFSVFGAGVSYLLRHDGQAAEAGESEPRAIPPARGGHHARARAVAGGVATCARSHRHLGGDHRLRRLRLCRDGRLRPRHRHPVPVPQAGRERDQAMNSIAPGLGRQRDLAGARRRRAVRGVSARLCDPPAGDSIRRSSRCCSAWCFAASRSNSAGAIRSTARCWDIALSPRLVDRRACARGSRSARCCRASKVGNGAYAGGWLDWLSPFTLLTGVSVVVGYALLGATWLVWSTEGVVSGAGAALGAVAGERDAAGDGRGQRGDAVPRLRLLAALVLAAERSRHGAGAAAGGDGRRGADRQFAARRGAICPSSPRSGCSGSAICGLGDQPVSLHRAARADDLGRRRPAVEPGSSCWSARASSCR